MPRLATPDGASLRWEETPGEGVPVLLLHGVLSSCDAWRGVAARLAAAGRRVLLLDDRGHGGSSPDVRDWSPQAAARDALLLLRHAAPEGAHLVGHSRGATAASWIAVEEPTLARSLALVASPPQATEVFRATFRRQLAHAKDERARAALRYLSEIPDDDFPTYALRQYRGRALVVEAEDDPLYGPTSTLFWRAFLPYADFERVPGGHEFFRESPEKEAWLADRLLRHLAEAEKVA